MMPPAQRFGPAPQPFERRREPTPQAPPPRVLPAPAPSVPAAPEEHRRFQAAPQPPQPSHPAPIQAGRRPPPERVGPFDAGRARPPQENRAHGERPQPGNGAGNR